jgi:hypothetical protein
MRMVGFIFFKALAPAESKGLVRGTVFKLEFFRWIDDVPVAMLRAVSTTQQAVVGFRVGTWVDKNNPGKVYRGAKSRSLTADD